MPRLEAIRPGETFESTLDALPLPRLLVGLLRANLSGLLELPIEANVANFLYFKEGVPVSVTLPSLHVSLTEILERDGVLEAEEAERLTRASRVEGASESQLIEGLGRVPEGRLRAAMRQRARRQLARLVGMTGQRFSFHEGRAMPQRAERIVLQPLPIIFEGLSSPIGRPLVDAFMAEHVGRRFVLSDTYPRGVDPFEWGDAVERIVEAFQEPKSIEELALDGLDAAAGAVMMTLSLADMVALYGEDTPLPERPAPLDLEAQSGVVLATRTGDADVNPTGPTSVPPRATSATAQSPAFQEITRRLEPFRGKNYYELLRIRPETVVSQMERSYQYLLQTAIEGDDVGAQMARDFLGEAFAVVSDPKKNAEYAKLVKKATTQKGIKKRQAFEAGPKLARIARAIAENRLLEAAYLLQWASALDAERPDLAAHRSFLQFCRVPGPEKPQMAATVAPVLESYLAQAPSDVTVKLYSVIAHVALGQGPKAKARFSELSDSCPNPLYPLAARAVAAIG